MGDANEGAQSFVGTLAYMSPSRIQGLPYSYETDMWSLGITMIAIMEGKPPFPTNRGHWQLMDAILHGSEPTLELKEPSPDLRDFISQCLNVPSGDKMFANTLLNHAFLSSARERILSEPLLLPFHRLHSRNDESAIDKIVETAISWQLERLGDENFQRSIEKEADGEKKNLVQPKLPQFSLSQIEWLAAQMVIESSILQKK
jgi:serine/threonine protein kinase